jgi:hypothetical protein
MEPVSYLPGTAFGSYKCVADTTFPLKIDIKG